jgi:hypothetical protein
MWDMFGKFFRTFVSFNCSISPHTKECCWVSRSWSTEDAALNLWLNAALSMSHTCDHQYLVLISNFPFSSQKSREQKTPFPRLLFFFFSNSVKHIFIYHILEYISHKNLFLKKWLYLVFGRFLLEQNFYGNFLRTAGNRGLPESWIWIVGFRPKI